jgi:WD40 repeat protein
MRTLQKTESRCLSLEVSPDDKFIFSGYADGSIRKWEILSGNCVLHIQTSTKKKSVEQE